MIDKTSLPHYDPDRPGGWGMFGYSGYCCDLAIRRNDPVQAEECWKRGYMDFDTRMLIGTVGQACERRAPAVAECLESLGPCKTEPMQDEQFMEAVSA